MASVNFTYTPADGVLFSVSGWNGNIRSTTSGVSIYGELNGGLVDANVAVGETFGAWAFKPGEPHKGAEAGELVVRDYHDDLFGQDTAPSNDSWLVVAGTALNIYVPWEAKAILWNISAFMTHWRQRETADSTPAVLQSGGPEIYVRMSVDGDPKEHTRRPFPYTAYPTVNPGDAGTMTYHVNVLPQHIDLVHLETNVAQGWHSVRLEILIPRTQGVESIKAIYETTTDVDHFVRHHVRIGCRRAMIVAM